MVPIVDTTPTDRKNDVAHGHLRAETNETREESRNGWPKMNEYLKTRLEALEGTLESIEENDPDSNSGYSIGNYIRGQIDIIKEIMAVLPLIIPRNRKTIKKCRCTVGNNPGEVTQFCKECGIDHEPEPEGPVFIKDSCMCGKIKNKKDKFCDVCWEYLQGKQRQCGE